MTSGSLFRSAFIGLAAILFTAGLRAQLPDPSALLTEVKANQHKLDEIRENYTFHVLRRTDQLDKKGAIVKSTSVEREVFFVNGQRVARLVKRDGQPLAPSEDAAEQARVKKLVESIVKGGHGGGPPSGFRIGEVSDILSVVVISNPRRVTLHNRPTLAYDFTGDPKAKAHGMEENAAKRMSGTLWFDETDRQVARVEVRFEDNFHIGGGILASVQRGSSMEFEQTPVGDGLWMPSASAEHVEARVVVKRLREDVHVTNFDFRRFNTGVIQQTSGASK